MIDDCLSPLTRRGFISKGGPINLLDNLDNLGSVESPLTAAEQEMAQLELSGSYMLVEWTDSQGRSKAERIPLEVL